MAETAVKVYYGNLMMRPDLSRVLACLHEKDVKYELVNINKGRLPVPVDLLSLQEQATMNRVRGPPFEDGRKILFESRAICRHLAEKYAEKGNKYLLGRYPLERASIEQWLRSEEHSFDPPSWMLVLHSAFPTSSMELERNAELMIEECERKLSEVLDVYNQRLGETKYLAGNEFSLADLSHLPNSHYLANSKEWSYLINSKKYVKKWFKKISERPSWVKAIETVEGLLSPMQRRPPPVAADSKGLVPQRPGDFDRHHQSKRTSSDSSPPPDQSKKPLLPTTAYQPPKRPTDPSLLQEQAALPSATLPTLNQAKVAPPAEPPLPPPPPSRKTPYVSKSNASHQPPTQIKAVTPAKPEPPQSVGSYTQKSSQLQKPAETSKLPEVPKFKQSSMETSADKEKRLEPVAPPHTPKHGTNMVKEIPPHGHVSKSNASHQPPTQIKAVTPAKPEPPQSVGSYTQKSSQLQKPAETSKLPEVPEFKQSSMETSADKEKRLEPVAPPHTPKHGTDMVKEIPVVPEKATWVPENKMEEPTMIYKPASTSNTAQRKAHQPSVTSSEPPTSEKREAAILDEKSVEKRERSILAESHGPISEPAKRTTETVESGRRSADKMESSIPPKVTARVTTQPGAPTLTIPQTTDQVKSSTQDATTLSTKPLLQTTEQEERKEKVQPATTKSVVSMPTKQSETSQARRPEPTEISMQGKEGTVSPRPGASLSTARTEKTAAGSPPAKTPTQTPSPDGKPTPRVESSSPPPPEGDQSSPSSGGSSQPTTGPSSH